jgi:tetratricopeptide (TPR) repeat protein
MSATHASPAPRAERALLWLGELALGALIALGLFHSLRAAHRLPTLRENTLTPLNAALARGATPELVRELRTASLFLDDPALAQRLVQAAEESKDLDGRIFGTRRLIELGAARDAATRNRLAALLLKRAHALDSLGSTGERSARELEDVREALSWAESVTREAPDAEATFHQGVARAGLGELEAGRALLAEALRLDPDLAAARRVLERLPQRPVTR